MNAGIEAPVNKSGPSSYQTRPPAHPRAGSEMIRKIKRDRYMILMMIPGLLIFLLFRYLPMFGLIAAFEDYKSYMGFFRSRWVGFANFQRFFQDPIFWPLLRNTVLLGVYHILFVFPLPIIVALMLNEVRSTALKRAVQTVVYMPHFLSWVVVASLTITFFASQDGIVNTWMGTHYNVLANPHTFRATIILQQIWKETGWGTILYLAALTGVDPQLYEAAEIDGATRWKQLWHITLPSIRGTIVIMLILAMGSFLNTGFEQILLMLNPLNQNVGNVYDTFVYKMGINNGELSYTTAVGLFKSVAALILMTLSNNITKRLGETGLY